MKPLYSVCYKIIRYKKAELLKNAESQTRGRLFATKGGEVGREYACLSD